MTTHSWARPVVGSFSAVKIGALCVGFVIAYIGMYFVSRLGDYTMEGLVAFLAAILGGAAFAYLGKLGGDSNTFGYYGIGLAVGLVVWIVLVALLQAPAAMAPFDYAVPTPIASPAP